MKGRRCDAIFGLTRHFKPVLLFSLLIGCASATEKDAARAPFLLPYVQQLEKSTSADDLRKITAMAESDLILLLHGYGTGIRNKWIHGNRDPQLVQFFHSKGVDDPEEASMIVIEALWSDLNSKLSPKERVAIEAKRATVARKRTSYAQLESECETQLAKAKGEFARCYLSFGLPSKNPESREPFFELLVARSGHVREIIFFEGASPELKTALAKTLNEFTFSPFREDEFVTLSIINFPQCRVAERDTLDD